MNDKNIITAKQMMKATIGGENKEEINKEIEKINKGNGTVSHQEMREYLLKEPSEGFKKAEKLYELSDSQESDLGNIDEDESSNTDFENLDFYNEYARQFGGMLIKLMEEKPHLAKSTDWLLTAKKELILKDRMEDWLTAFSAKWAESAARYVLNKPYIAIRKEEK